MPFKSAKQKRYLFANKPKLAKKWAKEYKEGGPIKSRETPLKGKFKDLNKKRQPKTRRIIMKGAR
jgi:hypothetical protein|tara:strand:- start:1046 stop:1240 length:195 start_codon:yes stop_codon:yes gene_type:complete